MKILVIIISPLGDTLFATPALKALRNGYPGAEIDVIVSEESKEILIGNKNINNLIVSKSKTQLLTLLFDLKDTEYNFGVGLSNKGSYLLPLVNVRKKVGFKGDDLGYMYDGDLPDKRDIHAVDYCLELVMSIGGIPDKYPSMEIPITEDNRLKVEEKLKNEGFISHLPIVAIHPGGKYFSLKRWPVSRFKETVKILDQEMGIQVVLIGGCNDYKLAEKVIDHGYSYEHLPFNLCGILSIKETAALLKKADLFIGNDSAPQHIAAAMETPIVSLFGPTDPVNFHPYGTDYKVICPDLSCNPCFHWLGDISQYIPEYLPKWVNRCQGACMEEITVKQVVEAVETLMYSKSTTSEVPVLV